MLPVCSSAMATTSCKRWSDAEGIKGAVLRTTERKVTFVMEHGLRARRRAAETFVAAKPMQRLPLADYQQRTEALHMYGCPLNDARAETFCRGLTTHMLPRLVFVAEHACDRRAAGLLACTSWCERSNCWQVSLRNHCSCSASTCVTRAQSAVRTGKGASAAYSVFAQAIFRTWWAPVSTIKSSGRQAARPPSRPLARSSTSASPPAVRPGCVACVPGLAQLQQTRSVLASRRRLCVCCASRRSHLLLPIVAATLCSASRTSRDTCS